MRPPRRRRRSTPPGIDWRFADPAADSLAVLNSGKLAASPLAHSLIDQLGAGQGLSAAEAQNTFRALSGVNQMAVSVHGDRIVFFVTGRQSDAILPALETGWKYAPLPGNMLLIGHTDAVNEAVQRIALATAPLSDLASMAIGRPDDSEFWAVASANLVGPEAAKAGVQRFSLTASMRDSLISDTIFEFNGDPDASAVKRWLNTLGDAQLDGPIVHAKMSMKLEETKQNSGQIAASPFGQRLGALIQSARYLPVRDTATTVHTKPVIFGLDDGPREVK